MSVSSHPSLFHMLYITSSNLPHSGSKRAGGKGFPQSPRLSTASHLFFAGPHSEKQKHSTITKSSHQTSCSSSRPGFQADFFLAHGNVLALIWPWFLSHFLTNVLKKGIHRNSWSAISDIFTHVKEMNMIIDFRLSSSIYLVHQVL